HQETMRVKITNPGAFKKVYRPAFLKYIQKKDGSFKTVESKKGMTFAEEFLKVEPKEMALDSEESGYFEISFKDEGADVKTGEYLSYFAVLEKEHPDFIQPDVINGQWIIKSEYRVAIPLVLRQGLLSAEADIKSVKLKSKKAPSDKKSKKKAKKEALLQLDLVRDGNKSIRGNIEIFDGEDLIGILNGVAVYTHIKSRQVEIPLNRLIVDKDEQKTYVPIEEKELKGKEVKIKFTGNIEDEIPLEIIKTFKL
ncbi:MAG: hypothetical protein JXQ74_03370, partial [Alphaproteobacteria bacterium]|nr:hypothetical protein [Alphaproteobacteria bacterium]